MAKNLKPINRPESYDSFKGLCDELKSTVYAIVRVRKNTSGGTTTATLGTGFIAGPQRLATCAHVINGAKAAPDDMHLHKPGDLYMFIQRDDLGNKHVVSKTFTIGNDLLLFDTIDFAYFKLGDWFYLEGKTYRQHPDNYLKFSLKHIPIGSEAGVLGYPFSNVKFKPDGSPLVENIVIRADKGVVNTKGKFGSIQTYEFSMAFNPGNSGGPVIDLISGEVIGIVQGVQWYLTDNKPVDFVENGNTYKGLITVTSTYSRAITPNNLNKLNLLKKCYLK